MFVLFFSCFQKKDGRESEKKTKETIRMNRKKEREEERKKERKKVTERSQDGGGVVNELARVVDFLIIAKKNPAYPKSKTSMGVDGEFAKTAVD